jgi:hypothetical protein
MTGILSHVAGKKMRQLSGAVAGMLFLAFEAAGQMSERECTDLKALLGHAPSGFTEVIDEKSRADTPFSVVYDVTDYPKTLFNSCELYIDDDDTRTLVCYVYKATRDEKPGNWSPEQTKVMVNVANETAKHLGVCLGASGEHFSYSKNNATHLSWEWSVRVSGSAHSGTDVSLVWSVRVPDPGKTLQGVARREAEPEAYMAFELAP